MKTTTASLRLLVLAVLLAGTIACEKGTGTDLSDLTASENSALAEQQSDDISQIIDDAMNENGGDLSAYRVSGEQETSTILSPCAVITRDTVSIPHVVTVDFGPENCLCRDGRYRRGKLIATFSGPYRAEGTVITHTTQDYYVDDNRVDAEKSVTNAGRNERGHLHFSIEANATITLASGEGTLKHRARRDREWILGEATPERLDDVYLIRGSGHCISASGAEYHTEIQLPLRKEMGFPFMIAGTEKVVRVDEETRVSTLDYGFPNGERDNLALVTFGNGDTRVIRLR